MSCHVFRLIIELQLHYIRANADNPLFPFCSVGFCMSSAQNKIWEPRYIHEYQRGRALAKYFTEPED